MHKYLLVLLVLFTTQIKAQDTASLQKAAINTSRFLSGIPYAESGFKQSLSVNAGAGLQGNAVDGYAIKSVVIDKYLYADNKANIESRLKDYNWAYYNQQYNLTYYKQTKLKWLDGFAIHASRATFANATFSSDAFKLAAEGNAAFENKTANFDNTTLRYTSFYAGGGTMVFKLFGGQLHIGATGEYVGATNGADLRITNGSLYTATDGEYIDAQIKGDLYAPDTAHAQRNAIKGNGYRVGGFIEWQATDDDIFTVTAQNIGQVQWNNKSEHFHVDTSIHYDGYNVTSLFNTSQSGLSFNSDSVSKIFHIKANKSTFTQNLVPLFSLQYIHIANKINTLFGLRAVMHDDLEYSSSVKVFGQYHFKNNWNVGLSVTYYAGNMIGTGVMAGKSWKHIHAYLTSDNVLQYWNLSQLTNENLLARLSYTF